MENSVLPLVWKLYFEELSSAVHSQFSTHFVPRRLHSPSSTLTRFHFQKEKRDDTLTTCSRYFRESFSMIFQHQSRSLWKNALKNFRKRYLLYGGTAISKLYKNVGRRLFPSKVSEQSRFRRLFREKENASFKIHIRVTIFGNIPLPGDR